MGTLQDSSQRISGVVGEVRRRTRTSSASARELSGLTEQLRRSGPAGLDGGVDGNQIRGGGDGEDILGEGAVSGVTAAAGSTRGLAGDMAGIAAGMDTNQEIVGELQRQVVRQIPGASGEIVHRAGDHAAYLLDMAGGVRAGVGQTADFLNQQADRLRTAMAEIASSISAISGAVDGAVSGVTAAAGSTRGLAGDMAGIASRLSKNPPPSGIPRL